MALADFTFQTDNAGVITHTATGVSPIQGAASFQAQVASNATAIWILGYTAGLTKDCVDCKVLIQMRSTSPTPSFYVMGLIAQIQGAIDIGTSGYTAMLTDGLLGGSGTLVLNKAPVSFAVSDSSGQANTTVTLPAQNEVAALGIRCEHNGGGGTVLVSVSYDPGPISIPVASDYSFPGLVTQLSWEDVSGVLVSGTFGVFGRNAGALVGSQSQVFDVLSVDTD